MKRFAQHILAFSILAILLNLSLFTRGTRITILHVNDTHSHLEAIGPKNMNLEGTLGGMAKAATLIRKIRATEPNVLLLHAGDLFEGDPYFNKYVGVPEFQLMTELGFDAMAVGNHEFDLGLSVLNQTLSTAFAEGSFPLVSANLDMSGYADLRKWIQPWIIRTVAGVRIRIFRMTIPDDPTTQLTPVVICLSHLGIHSDRLIAERVSGIDFIVGGHDRLVFQQPISIRNPSGKPTWIIHGGEHYKHVGNLRFRIAGASVQFLDYRLIPVGASVAPDPSIQSVVSTVKEEIVSQYRDVYQKVTARAARELGREVPEKNPMRDTPLGNLVTDAFRKKTGTDIALRANELVSEKIWAVPIVVADVLRPVSYGYDDSTKLGYKLATFEILGAELVKGLEVGLSQLPNNDSHFIQVSGMKYEYNPNQPAAKRVVLESVWVGGKPLSPSAKYTVTVNTGIIGLLSAIGVSMENIRVLPDFEHTVVRDYIAQLGKIDHSPEGRIREVGSATRD